MQKYSEYYFLSMKVVCVSVTQSFGQRFLPEMPYVSYIVDSTTFLTKTV